MPASGRLDVMRTRMRAIAMKKALMQTKTLLIDSEQLRLVPANYPQSVCS